MLPEHRSFSLCERSCVDVKAGAAAATRKVCLQIQMTQRGLSARARMQMELCLITCPPWGVHSDVHQQVSLYTCWSCAFWHSWVQRRGSGYLLWVHPEPLLCDWALLYYFPNLVGGGFCALIVHLTGQDLVWLPRFTKLYTEIQRFKWFF